MKLELKLIFFLEKEDASKLKIKTNAESILINKYSIWQFKAFNTQTISFLF
jgi:hypothetical protein